MGDSMSGILLTGDTSGTLTLAAPAVAGSNTLTLPAKTGNVAVDGPAFSVITSTTSCTGSTVTTIKHSSKTFDTANAYDTSTGRFTPQVAGYYQFTAWYSFYGSTNVNGQSIAIRKNGSETGGQFGLTNGTAGDSAWWVVGCSGLLYLNGTTDYATSTIYFNGSSTFSLGNAAFTGIFIRGA